MESTHTFRYNKYIQNREDKHKMKGKVFVVIGFTIIVICCVIAGLYRLENYEEVYFTKIDNTKAEKLPTSDDMKYEYTLDCYNNKGKKKQLKFKTSRELKENAYLLLSVRSFGVHKWEEITYNDLPQAVQEEIDP